jgi:deoxyribose-phosphate aldolase
MKQIDDLAIKTEVATLLKNHVSKLTHQEALQLILNCIDLTTLEGKDHDARVIALCKQAKSYHINGPSVPNVAAVCVYPTFAQLAKSQLHDTSIHVACVAGAFPSGQSPLHLRVAEVKYAVEQGADEIDMVISRGKFLEGDYDFVFSEVKAIKESCGQAHLKVILETGELENMSQVFLASQISIEAGADFIKTSTGKIQPAATLEAFYTMLLVIKETYQKTGKIIGIKPAGGVAEVEDALQYLYLLESVLGEKWMNNKLFRIGASRLADKVMAQLK